MAKGDWREALIVDGVWYDTLPGSVSVNNGVQRSTTAMLDLTTKTVTWHDLEDVSVPNKNVRKARHQTIRMQWDSEAYCDRCLYDHLTSLYSMQKPVYFQCDDAFSREFARCRGGSDRVSYFTPTWPIKPLGWSPILDVDWSDTVVVDGAYYDDFTVHEELGIIEFPSELSATQAVYASYSWRLFGRITSINLQVVPGVWYSDRPVYQGEIEIEQVPWPDSSTYIDPWVGWSVCAEPKGELAIVENCSCREYDTEIDGDAPPVETTAVDPNYSVRVTVNAADDDLLPADHYIDSVTLSMTATPDMAYAEADQAMGLYMEAWRSYSGDLLHRTTQYAYYGPTAYAVEVPFATLLPGNDQFSYPPNDIFDDINQLKGLATNDMPTPFDLQNFDIVVEYVANNAGFTYTQAYNRATGANADVQELLVTHSGALTNYPDTVLGPFELTFPDGDGPKDWPPLGPPPIASDILLHNEAAAYAVASHDVSRGRAYAETRWTAAVRFIWNKAPVPPPTSLTVRVRARMEGYILNVGYISLHNAFNDLSVDEGGGRFATDGTRDYVLNFDASGTAEIVLNGIAQANDTPTVRNIQEPLYAEVKSLVSVEMIVGEHSISIDDVAMTVTHLPLCRDRSTYEDAYINNGVSDVEITSAGWNGVESDLSYAPNHSGDYQPPINDPYTLRFNNWVDFVTSDKIADYAAQEIAGLRVTGEVIVQTVTGAMPTRQFDFQLEYDDGAPVLGGTTSYNIAPDVWTAIDIGGPYVKHGLGTNTLADVQNYSLLCTGTNTAGDHAIVFRNLTLTIYFIPTCQ